MKFEHLKFGRPQFGYYKILVPDVYFSMAQSRRQLNQFWEPSSVLGTIL